MVRYRQSRNQWICDNKPVEKSVKADPGCERKQLKPTLPSGMITRWKNTWDAAKHFRRFSIFLIFTVCFHLTGCSSELPRSRTITKSGKVYEIGKEKPFSGWVIGTKRKAEYSEILDYKEQYKRGVRHGKSIYWYKNGKIESIEIYKEGQLNGLSRYYHRNGRKKAIIHFVGGNRGGESGEMFWDEKGNILR